MVKTSNAFWGVVFFLAVFIGLVSPHPALHPLCTKHLHFAFPSSHEVLSACYHSTECCTGVTLQASPSLLTPLILSTPLASLFRGLFICGTRM